MPQNKFYMIKWEHTFPFPKDKQCGVCEKIFCDKKEAEAYAQKMVLEDRGLKQYRVVEVIQNEVKPKPKNLYP